MAMWRKRQKENRRPRQGLKLRCNKPRTPGVGGHHWKAGRGKEGFSSTNWGGSMALPVPWFQISRLQNCQRISFWCLKPLSLWYFVMAVLGNYHKCLWYIFSMMAERENKLVWVNTVINLTCYIFFLVKLTFENYPCTPKIFDKIT